MAPYKEDFPVGSSVRIMDSEGLGEFSRSWKFHHPLSPEQMQFAGKTVVVEAVGFYHGGDVLYTLRGTPGYWHEQCLQASSAL
jgi:hypothetical protein